MRILVVDDEQDVRDLFSQRFRREVKRGELMIDFAHSGEDALELLAQEKRPDYVLILSDINMPGESGIEFYQYCTEHHPDISFILMTGLLIQDRSLKIPIIEKPVSAQEIIFHINTVL